jgi:hypothetical protein
MKSFLTLGAIALFGASYCMAESWNGKLVDAACMQRQSGANSSESQTQSQRSQSSQSASACTPTRSTTTFGIETPDGQMMRLDSTGNAKAAEMVRSANMSNETNGIPVMVTGTQEGHTLRVESIQIEK